MKRILALTLPALLLFSLITACGSFMLLYGSDKPPVSHDATEPEANTPFLPDITPDMAPAESEDEIPEPSGPDIIVGEPPAPPPAATAAVPVIRLTVSADRDEINWNTGRQLPTYSIGERCVFTVSIYPLDANDEAYTVSISGAKSTLNGNTISLEEAGSVFITVTAANGVKGIREISVVDLDMYADQVFKLTNTEREKEGLPAFGQITELTETAVVRAHEIIRHFAHERPDGRSCFTAYDENSVTYKRAAENVAYGQSTPKIVVDAWMDSPGHRANIMDESLDTVGIGVAIDEQGVLYWSQNFIG